MNFKVKHNEAFIKIKDNPITRVVITSAVY